MTKKMIIFPIKVVEQVNCIGYENLLIKKVLQIGLNEKDLLNAKSNAYIVLDFGKEYRGTLRILTFTQRNAKIRIRLGESLSECYSDIGYKNSTNDHSNRDIETYLQNYSDMIFMNSGFRFVRIDMVEGDADIKSIVIESEIFKGRTIYEYDKNDLEIKKIFYTAKRTIDLCAAGNFLWDGIKRDRLVWVGDMHPEMLALTTLYGRSRILENSLEFVKKEYKPMEWMNWLPNYSIWWINIVTDYYTQTNNLSFFKKQVSYIQKIIAHLDSCINEEGNIDFPDYFIDAKTMDMECAKDGSRALCIWTLINLKTVFLSLGLNVDLVCSLLSRLKKKAINCYGKKQIIALKYFALGKMSDTEKRQLTEGGARGMSCFLSYYILTAIASFDKEKAILIMKEYFGAMIDKGATTFWEDFDIEWCQGSGRIDEKTGNNLKDIHGDFGRRCYKGYRHSLCHGWASGVVKFIKENC